MANAAPPRAYNDHNVYIVGAGFSAEAHLPLIKDFMNVMRDSLEWLEKQNGRTRERDAIQKVLGFRLKAASAAYRVDLDVENIEELFSLAAASSGDSDNPADQVTLAIAATLDYARKNSPAVMCRFSAARNVWSPPTSWKQIPELSPPSYEIPLHQSYLALIGGAAHLNERSLGRQDTIISFNYDLVAEEALHELGLRFGYGFASNQAEFHRTAQAVPEPNEAVVARLLKVHGSVNWALAGGINGKLTVFGSYDDVRIAGLNPYLVPPTWRKGFGSDLSYVWEAAVGALTTATNVVIIGYSIPETDFHFKYLLAAGLRENISLRKIFFVNPQGDALREKLFTIVRPEQEQLKRTEICPISASQFFLGSGNSQNYRDEINRPLKKDVTAFRWG